MKAFFALLIIAISSPIYASTSLDEVLGSCNSDFSAYLQDAKMELISNSIWNYDNDYYLDDVQSSVSVVAGQKLVNVYVYFDIDGLRDRGFNYNFKPYFQGQNNEVCSFINVDLISKD